MVVLVTEPISRPVYPLLCYGLMVLLTESFSIPAYPHPHYVLQVQVLLTEPISIPVYPYPYYGPVLLSPGASVADRTHLYTRLPLP